MSRLTVVCVLKTGGDFDASWVWALRCGVRKHLSIPYEFVCLSDDPEAPNRIPLENDWPGRSSKLELFRPGLFSGPVFYLDLDTLPVRNFDAVASYEGGFAMIRDLWSHRHLRSGLIAWTPGPQTERIYSNFVTRASRVATTTIKDGRYMVEQVADADALQDAAPGQIVSLKAKKSDRRGTIKSSGPPVGASLVCGHGRPRLSSPQAGWAHKLWKERCFA